MGTELADMIVDEANKAFRFNTAIFQELDIVAGLRTASKVFTVYLGSAAALKLPSWPRPWV